MINFEYAAPTKVIFGRGAEDAVGREIQALGGTNVMIHFGAGRHLQDSGLLERVHNSLTALNLRFVDFGGAVPNPRMSLVKAGIAKARAESVDFILAIGGGSAIDSAKAIAYGLANDFAVEDLFPDCQRQH